MEYGLIGEKLGHSFSKEIHKLIGNYDYILREIPKNELTHFMEIRDFKGINVTIPYKQDVIPFLDYIDDGAKEIGAVNTIVNKNGKLFGYNTDFIGLRNLIIKLGLQLQDKKVLILGTGGTSKTAMAVAKSLGATTIYKVSRSQNENSISYEEAITVHNDANVIINATPCGMFPNVQSSPINLQPFTNLEGVVDVIYNPLQSTFVLNGMKKGVKASGGLFMLVDQAIEASKKFFDKQIPEEKVDYIYNTVKSQKLNIVLTGMPGSGKTTIGKLLATKLGKTFYDTDEVITEQEKMTPSEIITQKGEPSFRQIESDVCKKLSIVNNCIIATGGGVVLQEQNVLNLKHNGKIIFINRDLSRITPTKDRPLSDNECKLRQVYETRLPIYQKSADYIIPNNQTEQEAVKEILGVINYEN